MHTKNASTPSVREGLGKKEGVGAGVGVGVVLVGVVLVGVVLSS